MDRVKTIQVRAGTKRKLDSIGRKGDTYDVIIRKLIEAYVAATGRFVSPLEGGKSEPRLRGEY